MNCPNFYQLYVCVERNRSFSRRSCHRRWLRWYRVCNGPRLSGRDRTERNSRTSYIAAAMGYYVGYLDSIFHCGPLVLVMTAIPILTTLQQYGASNIDGGPNNPTQSTAAFRIPWGIQIVPGVILFFGMFLFPKSPRWLASKDRWEEALNVLSKLHGNGDVNHPKVLAEYKEIQEALALEREQTNTGFQELVKPRIFKRVILGMSLQMWSQLCGMNVMMYYIGMFGISNTRIDHQPLLV